MIEVKIEEKIVTPYIFKIRNIVRSKKSIVLVISNSPIDSGTFEGVSIHCDRDEFGEYSEDWNKEDFTQFTGSITLTYKP